MEICLQKEGVEIWRERSRETSERDRVGIELIIYNIILLWEEGEVPLIWRRSDSARALPSSSSSSTSIYLRLKSAIFHFHEKNPMLSSGLYVERESCGTSYNHQSSNPPVLSNSVARRKLCFFRQTQKLTMLCKSFPYPDNQQESEVWEKAREEDELNLIEEERK